MIIEKISKLRPEHKRCLILFTISAVAWSGVIFAGYELFAYKKLLYHSPEYSAEGANFILRVLLYALVSGLAFLIWGLTSLLYRTRKKLYFSLLAGISIIIIIAAVIVFREFG
jgi:hypothetical protein